MLGAKYFPDKDILGAKKKCGMSYTWRSIMQGIEVMKNGMIWRVGNGKKINIWAYPWLPREWLRRSVTPRAGTLRTEVEDLMDPISERWDEELIRQTFWDEDVSLILSILVHVELEDVMAWYYDTKGLFSVRSPYKVRGASEIRGRRGGAASSSAGT